MTCETPTGGALLCAEPVDPYRTAVVVFVGLVILSPVLVAIYALARAAIQSYRESRPERG